MVSWFSCHHWFCHCTLTVRKQWNGSQLSGLSSNQSILLGESIQSSIWFLGHYFSGSCFKITSIVWQIISFFDICRAVIVLYCFFLLFSGLAVKYFTRWICFFFSGRRRLFCSGHQGRKQRLKFCCLLRQIDIFIYKYIYYPPIWTTRLYLGLLSNSGDAFICVTFQSSLYL